MFYESNLLLKMPQKSISNFDFLLLFAYFDNVPLNKLNKGHFSTIFLGVWQNYLVLSIDNYDALNLILDIKFGVSLNLAVWDLGRRDNAIYGTF